MCEKVSIRVDLEGKSAEWFETVKKNLGLKQNTEVIRSLVRDAYLNIQREAGKVEPEVA